MCFRPPTVDGAQIACPKCGADMPMSAAKCPQCGTPNAANASAAPPVLPSVPSMKKPTAPSAAKAPTAPGGPPKAAAAAQQAPKAAASAAPAQDDSTIDAPSIDSMDLGAASQVVAMPAATGMPVGDSVSLTINLGSKKATYALLKSLETITSSMAASEKKVSAATVVQPAATVESIASATAPTMSANNPKPWAQKSAADDSTEVTVPVVGGQMRTVLGAESLLAGDAPEAPTGPGFEEAPDISNTGNYFIDAQYNNG